MTFSRIDGNVNVGVINKTGIRCLDSNVQQFEGRNVQQFEGRNVQQFEGRNVQQFEGRIYKALGVSIALKTYWPSPLTVFLLHQYMKK